jgi:hypothetical protein
MAALLTVSVERAESAPALAAIRLVKPTGRAPGRALKPPTTTIFQLLV